jgi:hypothetical protein
MMTPTPASTLCSHHSASELIVLAFTCKGHPAVLDFLWLASVPGMECSPVPTILSQMTEFPSFKAQ